MVSRWRRVSSTSPSARWPPPLRSQRDAPSKSLRGAITSAHQCACDIDPDASTP